MGYQEMLIKTKISHIPKIREKIKLSGMGLFIDLAGYYKPKYDSKYIYLVTTGDRHPGADFVHTEFGGQPIEEIFDFEEILINSGNFEFVKFDQKESEV